MVEGKQVKVDNWGIFFLQRLQQYYTKTFFCDLTLQFEDNVQVKVHRLVMNACTEYFQMLENTCEMQKDCLMMPSNLPADVVIPIINFMYSGILEFQESLFDRLYSTAKLMNMSVLTKLLDAQKTPIKPITPVPKRVQSVTPITWNLQGKKIMTKNFMEPDLPETLPGRKLPIWKRKSAPSSVSFVSANSSSNYDTYSPKVKSEEAPKPTRFEWPDEDDNNFENSFDEISYASKPLILPSVQAVKEKSPKPSTSSTFEEIKKTALPVKRSASPIGNQCKKVNIQDVKEYLKEHKIRSDFIDYDDSEMADNDLQTYDNDDSNEERSQDASDIFTQNTEESPSKSILKSESSTPTTNKHVRFSLEGKENSNTKVQPVAGKSQIPKPSPIKPAEQNTVDMSKHTKIITEVLKKYPHLVKNNKNIRLKILAKGNNPSSQKTTKAMAVAKPTSKVSYMVMKPDTNQKSNTTSSDKDNANNSETNSWECTRCEEPRQFQSYHTYRQHLTEAHNEKQDSQMCILCGHISRKQNMLVYHKYVKHNIPPPAMYNFPKCKDCNYVALSQTLLLRHQLSHNVLHMSCAECGVSCANKAALLAHIQQTGHSQDRVTPHFNCNYCDKRFFSENILNTHIKRTHTEVEEKTQTVQGKDENIKSEIEETIPKSKEKVKILSDIKVNTTLPAGTLVPVRTLSDLRTLKQENTNESVVPEPLEPSSEAEALSNVASGIAASLGLVDTIVVLDDNQFILQSTQHANMQENILNSSGQEYILPDMQISDLTSIASTSIDQVTRHPTVTLSSDTNTVLTQSLNKSGMTSTDELVMVLTDHDYSDAANNAVITDNNIVVLYSHPVQTQATMMINSETGMIEVGKNYAVTSEMPVSASDQVVGCEESIEMIQQEINNQLETENQEQQVEMQQYAQQNAIQNVEEIVEEKMEVESCVEPQENPYQVCNENVTMILENNQGNDMQKTVHMDEIPTPHQDIEESIEMIQDEINRIPQQITQELVEKVCEAQVHKSNISTSEIPETIHVNEGVYETAKENNFERNTNDYSQEIIATNTESIAAIQESGNNEEVIIEEHAMNLHDQSIMHTENITENIQMELSGLENKEFKSETEVICDPEESQTFNSDSVRQMDLIEQQTEYAEPVKIQVTEIDSNEIIDSQNITLQENTQSNSENMQIIEQISAESVQNEKIVMQEILQPMECTTEEVHMEQSIQENIQSMEIIEQKNVETDEQENIQIMEQNGQDNVEVIEPSMQIIEQGNQESIHVDHSFQCSEETKEVQEHIVEQVLHNEDNLEEHATNLQEKVDEILDNTEIPPEMEPMVEEKDNRSESTQEPFVVAENETSIEDLNDMKNVSDEIPITTIGTHEIVNKNEDTQKINEVDLNDMTNVSDEIPIVTIGTNEISNQTASITQDIQDKDEDSSESNEDQESNNVTNKIENKQVHVNVLQNEKISKLLDDWDDGDTDSQQSFSKSTPSTTVSNNGNSINKLIDDWEDEEDT